MHVASTGKHVLKKSPKLATHTTQCMAMLRKVHCVPANGSASHPPGAARHDAHFEAWETCENTTLSPTTGKGAFSGKKPPPNPFSLLVSFSPPRTFFGPRRGTGPFGPFSRAQNRASPERHADGRAPQKGTRQCSGVRRFLREKRPRNVESPAFSAKTSVEPDVSGPCSGKRI